MDWVGHKEPCIRVQIPHTKRQFWGQKRASSGHARTCSAVHIVKKRLGRGQNRYIAAADWGVLEVRIRLNRLCAAAMRPYVKLFWPLVYSGRPSYQSAVARFSPVPKWCYSCVWRDGERWLVITGLSVTVRPGSFTGMSWAQPLTVWLWPLCVADVDIINQSINQSIRALMQVDKPQRDRVNEYITATR